MNMDAQRRVDPGETSQCIEWYNEGQSRHVSVNGIDVIIRFVGRKNREARIAIEAPAGAIFRSLEPKAQMPISS